MNERIQVSVDKEIEDIVPTFLATEKRHRVHITLASWVVGPVIYTFQRPFPFCDSSFRQVTERESAGQGASALIDCIIEDSANSFISTLFDTILLSSNMNSGIIFERW